MIDLAHSSGFAPGHERSILGKAALAEQIDSVIEAVWGGLQASMRRQSAGHAVPF